MMGAAQGQYGGAIRVGTEMWRFSEQHPRLLKYCSLGSISHSTDSRGDLANAVRPPVGRPARKFVSDEHAARGDEDHREGC